MRTALITLALLALCSKAVAGGEEASEVAYLLEYVANSGCTFTRNGEQHNAAAAADHLRLKYSRGGRWVDSAEEFIDRLATASSWTHEPYTITCNGHTEPTGTWLHQALDNYRNSTAPATPDAS